MPVTRYGALAFHTQLLGAGPPCVMLHGLLVGSMTTWYFGAAPRLARTQRVLLYDLRGHGKSERPATGYDLATMTDDLEAIVTDFTGEPATLVGHSWGALVALSLAMRAPTKVRRLALVEAPLPPSQVGELPQFLRLPPEEMIAALPEPLRQLVAQGGRAARHFLEQLTALANETSIFSDLAAAGDVPDAELARVDCPTLLVYGERSSCRSTGERLARLLPKARLATLPGGHFLPTESGEALTATLADFCDG